MTSYFLIIEFKMNKATIDKVWNSAKIIKGKDPAEYRQDPYGNVMYKNSYGKNTDMGWEVDHIKPKSKGGSDAIRNLQALNSKINKSKSNSLVKKSRHSKGNK
jgi:5-methylcytosine-specific restriction endonuclease McrA